MFNTDSGLYYINGSLMNRTQLVYLFRNHGTIFKAILAGLEAPVYETLYGELSSKPTENLVIPVVYSVLRVHGELYGYKLTLKELYRLVEVRITLKHSIKKHHKSHSRWTSKRPKIGMLTKFYTRALEPDYPFRHQSRYNGWRTKYQNALDYDGWDTKHTSGWKARKQRKQWYNKRREN